MGVLIAEDESLIAIYLEALVVQFGHEVCALAASASDAVTQVAAHHPDVVLMDIRLAHGSSGIDAAREIYGRHGLRCIFVSGNLDEATLAAVRPCNPIAFIEKPVLPVRLQRALENAERGGETIG
jgi:DNA-binding NarL/FixJ family response regulator